MCPVLYLCGTAVSSYSFCAVLAGTVFVLLTAFLYRKKYLGPWQIFLPLLMAAAALIGARALNVLLNPGAYGLVFSPWKLSYEKMSLVGGLTAGFLPLLLFAHAKQRAVQVLLDPLVVPAALSIMILKTGCFLNGCCVGKETNGPLGMVFPANNTDYAILEELGLLHPGPHTVHPAQLYEIAGTLTALLLSVWLAHHLHLAPGGRFGLFAALFSLARLLILPIRLLPYPPLILHFAYPALYLAMILTGLWLCRRWGRQQADLFGGPS